MTDPRQAADDLRFIRRVLDHPSTPAPSAILLLWVALGVPGMALVDLAPAAVPWYWLVAGPTGFAASILLGRAAAARTGELDPASGLRWGWHWGVLLLAIAVVVLLAVGKILPFGAINPLALLLLGVAYGLAGLHLDRRLLWVAGAFVAGLPLATLVPRFGWLATGVLVGLTLIGVVLFTRRPVRG